MSHPIPAKANYASLAMLELAIRFDETAPVSLREITKRHGIPQPFLVQILQQLKLAGFVTSTRGSNGGYRLSVPPASLTLLDIWEAIGASECIDSNDSGDASDESNALQVIWQSAASAFREVLAATTLQQLASRAQRTETSMFYI